MNKVLSSLSLMMVSMGAHATMVEMDDAGLAEVHGQINLVSLVNVGIFSDSVFSLVSGFGADSLASGVQIAGGRSLFTGLNVLGATGATGLNLGGVSGFSIVNGLGLSGLSLANGPLGGVSVLSGISLPIGATGASVVTLPWTLNGFGAFNLF